ncbi:MAG: DUF3592 domain-containing protein [Oscillospiraceae bacterium]
MMIDLLFIVSGFFLLALAGAKFTSRSWINKKGVALTATVTDYKSSTGDEVKSYYPVFTFELEGKEHSVQYSVGSGKRYYEIGDKVDVVYHPGMAKSISIQKDRSFLLSYGTMFVLGAVLLLVGIWLFLWL